MNDSITKKSNLKKYATEFIHKLTMIPSKTKSHQQDTLSIDNNSSASSLSDIDKVPTPTGSMILFSQPNLHRHHKTMSSVSSLFDQSLVFTSTEDLYNKEKETKAIAMWQSTVQKLIIQKRMMEQHMKKNKYERDEALARFILNELHSTEKSFYQFLVYIRQNYMEPMIIASQTKHRLVKLSDVYLLFNYLPELINTSSKLLDRLEDIQDHAPGLAIGKVFKEMAPEFVIFLKYAIHYQSHLKSIRKASTSSYVTKINYEKRHEYNRLGLSDYLISPFQRVPRYELLLKDLLKHTAIKEDEDELSNELIYVNNMIHSLATTMNNVQEKILFIT